MKFGTSSRRFELTLEKSETVSIRLVRNVSIAWCGHCGRETRMCAPEAAAGIAGLSMRKIYAGIEDGSTHFNEAANGSILVCLQSIEHEKSRKGVSE